MFLQPEKAPVKVYRSSDKDAPRLEGNAGSLQIVLKACLVTGYGDKEGAGWTMAFEDTVKGIKVFRPAISPHTDFFMKVSNDTGRNAKFEVLKDMTDIDGGTPKLNLGSRSFSYRNNQQDGRWCVIACERGFWLFIESAQSRPINKNGVAVFCGDTAKNTKGERAVALVHTWDYGIFTNNSSYQVAIFDSDQISQKRVNSFFDGTTNRTTYAICSPVMIEHNNEIYPLPIYAPSNTNAVNYEEIVSHGRKFINHGHATYGNSNAFVPIDYWEY